MDQASCTSNRLIVKTMILNKNQWEKLNKRKVVVYDISMTYSNFYLNPCLTSYQEIFTNGVNGCKSLFEMEKVRLNKGSGSVIKRNRLVRPNR